MKLIFVASPYAGDVKKNKEYAKEACRHVLDEGHAFFCPHLLYPQILDDNNLEERKLGIKMGKKFLNQCDELWVFGKVITNGMFEEIEFARSKGIPIRRIMELNMEKNELALIRLGM